MTSLLMCRNPCHCVISQIVVLQEEREVLLSQLAQSQTACTQLREQLDTLQRQSISLQESCSKLQELNTKLQVLVCVCVINSVLKIFFPVMPSILS